MLCLILRQICFLLKYPCTNCSILNYPRAYTSKVHRTMLPLFSQAVDNTRLNVRRVALQTISWLLGDSAGAICHTNWVKLIIFWWRMQPLVDDFTIILLIQLIFSLSRFDLIFVTSRGNIRRRYYSEIITPLIRYIGIFRKVFNNLSNPSRFDLNTVCIEEAKRDTNRLIVHQQLVKNINTFYSMLFI